jgi:DNA polymerase-3 subunit alpha
VQADRFSGGMQLTITQMWDLEQARCRFGRYLRVAVKADGRAPDVAQLLREFPAKREMSEQGELVRGLAVRLVLECPADGEAQAPSAEGASAELQLGEAARFFPSDAALARWRAHADQGRAVVAYE